jgi:hypothetical protein
VSKCYDEPFPHAPDSVFNTKATNPKDAISGKKAQLWLVPPALVIGTSEAMLDGGRKYGPFNWRETGVRTTVYLSAMRRHLEAYSDGQDCAEDSGINHLKHIAACVAILLDAESVGMLNDDRPPAGAAAKLLEALVDDSA